VATTGGQGAELGLDDAILTRVVRKHRDAGTGATSLHRGAQTPGQQVEFGVHGDTDGLEGALGGMTPATTRRRGNRGGHDLGQMNGGVDRTRGDDGPGDARGEALVGQIA